VSKNQSEIEPDTRANVKRGEDTTAVLISGFKVTDVAFSENEACPTFMIANINPRFDIGYNLPRMEDIAQAAHQVNAEILILPELCISGYVWDADHKLEVQEQLKASDNRQPEVKKVLDGIKSGLVARGNGLKMVFFGNVRVDRSHGKTHAHDSTFVMTSSADYNDIFYDKIFLTPLEKFFFHRGTHERLVLDTPCGKMGVMMCYDLCFVEMGKMYAFHDEVDVVITTAAWRMEAVREYPLLNIKIDNYYQFIWRLMHSALAAHNQVWSIGANCVGVFEKTGGRFCGESGVWSPSGIPLVHGSHEEEELIVIRNLEIRGHMRHQAKEHFDYRFDFDEVYRHIRDVKPRRVLINDWRANPAI
jgi:N-carbamoylputrescine amidase